MRGSDVSRRPIQDAPRYPLDSCPADRPRVTALGENHGRKWRFGLPQDGVGSEPEINTHVLIDIETTLTRGMLFHLFEP